jgi:WNK lysine deficient protein kinase
VALVSAGTRRASVSNLDLRPSESFDSETSLKDYHNDCLIEEFISDVASLVNRPVEKANEWLIKLKGEDLLTVGDLRDLLEEDWARLNLTVFATRAIKNAIRGKGKPVGLDSLSPRVSGKIGETAGNL